MLLQQVLDLALIGPNQNSMPLPVSNVPHLMSVLSVTRAKATKGIDGRPFMPCTVSPAPCAGVLPRVRHTDAQTWLLHHVHKLEIKLCYAVSMLYSCSLIPTHTTSAACNKSFTLQCAPTLHTAMQPCCRFHWLRCPLSASTSMCTAATSPSCPEWRNGSTGSLRRGCYGRMCCRSG